MRHYMIIRIFRLMSLSVGASVATLILLEFMLVSFGYEKKEVWWQWATSPDNSKFVSDTRRIYRLREGVVIDSEPEMPLQTIDAHGRRISPCDSGRPVWMFVGDSYVYGHGVNDDDTLPAGVYRAMRQAGQSICTVNLGVQGYALAQSYEAFRAAIHDIRPDVVVWGMRPDDLYEKHLNRILRISETDIVTRRALWSGVYLQGLVNKYIGRFFPDSLLVNIIMYYLQDNRVSDNYTEYWRRSLPLLLDHISALSRRNNFSIFYVITPSTDIVPGEKDGSIVSQMYDVLSDTMRGRNDFLFDSNYIFRGEQVGEPVNKTSKYDLYFQPDGHLTASGNALLAEEIVRNLQPEIRATDSSIF